MDFGRIIGNSWKTALAAVLLTAQTAVFAADPVAPPKAQAAPAAKEIVPAAASVADKEDLALKSKGATVKADSEQEPGCAEKVIDGVIAGEKDFGNRWAASLEKGHAHWIEVYLPKAEVVDRVLIHFADPAVHPVWFEGFVMPEGSDKWEEVFGIVGYKDPRSFEGTIQAQPITGFRMLIYESASETVPNATQVSEIELFPAKK
jgi:hypothetical protein